MWSLVISVQYICIIFWIILSAFGNNISLTKSFVPIFFFVAILYSFYNLLKFNLHSFNKKYFIVITSLIFILLFTFIINYFRIFQDIEILLFSFIIPFTILFAQLIIWIFPVSEKQFLSIIKVLKLFFILNAIITLIFFFLINILQIIDLDLVWDLSIQNTVFMKIAGQTWFRTPGIFEIAGTNGTFLLMFLSMAISKFYYLENHTIFNKYLTYIFVISILIFFTLTRRTYLCLFVSILLLITLKTFKNPTIFKLLIFIFSIIAMMLGLFFINLKFHGILSLDSFYERLQFWYMSINNIIGEDIVNLFTGLSVLQSALKHSVMSLYTYSLLDNGFISCIFLSGIFFLLALIIYILLLFRDNIKMLNFNIYKEYSWIPLSNILMLINIVILMIFSTFIFNLTESFVYLIFVNYSTKYLLYKNMGV